MSNIIKSGVVLSADRRVVLHKPIHNKQQEDKLIQLNTDQVKSEITLVLEEKHTVEQEVKALQQQLIELRENITVEKQRAQEDVERMLVEHKKELERQKEKTLKQAEEQGFEAGYQAGYKQIQEEMAEKKAEMLAVVQSAYEHKERIIQDAEPFILNLSVKMAERIVQQELELSQEKILQMVQQSLKQVKERGEVVIEVAPQDYPTLLAHLDELEQYLDGTQELKIIPADVSQVSQGCLIHTNEGTYDVTIDNQLQELKKQLLSLFEESVCE